MMAEFAGGKSFANAPAFETRKDPHRVLLVADEIFRGDDLVAELRTHPGGQSDRIEVLVVSSAIAHSAIDQELGDVDGPSREAAIRLESILRELDEAGLDARGQIGDSDPVVAAGDGLAEFPADEIVVVSHSDTEREYAERGIWQRLGADFHQPVTQLKVAHPAADGTASGVVAVDHAPAHRRTEAEIIRDTRNFPPLGKLDLAGILIGFIGTVCLGMIAVAAGTDDPGQISGSAAVILLITIAAFLINVANIVGLLFFESVRYTGIWEKFFARASIGITTIGLVASLFLWLG